MDARQALLLTGSTPKALLKLAVPIILANLLQTGYQLTDATRWASCACPSSTSCSSSPTRCSRR